jgi:ubiquinone/menaquinone biosynthesis C-methylase UbiE
MQTIYHQERYAKEYDYDRFGGAFGRQLEHHEVETFFSMIEGTRGNILDIGTGTGKLSLPLLKRSRGVISVDASQEMIGIATRKAKKEGLILRSVICDAHYLCFKDSTFGCAVSSRLLMHLDDWKAAISEFCRVAEVVVIDFPPLRSFGGIDSLFKRLKKLISKDTSTYRAYSTKSLIRELQRNGFKIVESRRQFFLPITFHRFLNRPNLSFTIEKFLRLLGLVRFLGAPVAIKAIKNGYVKTQVNSDNSKDATSN